jgi:hypothetical protein
MVCEHVLYALADRRRDRCAPAPLLGSQGLFRLGFISSWRHSFSKWRDRDAFFFLLGPGYRDTYRMGSIGITWSGKSRSGEHSADGENT